MKANNFIVFPVELKYRLNYFGFYSDKMTKKAMDRVKDNRGDLLERDKQIIPKEMEQEIQMYLDEF